MQELLFLYGFALPANPHDRLLLHAPLSWLEPFGAVPSRLALLRSRVRPPPGSPSGHIAARPDWGARCLLRLVPAGRRPCASTLLCALCSPAADADCVPPLQGLSLRWLLPDLDEEPQAAMHAWQAAVAAARVVTMPAAEAEQAAAQEDSAVSATGHTEPVLARSFADIRCSIRNRIRCIILTFDCLV